MQTKSTLALTPALSRREREKQSQSLGRSPRGDGLQHGESVLPLLGERAGVRASLLSNCIMTAKRAALVWIFVLCAQNLIAEGVLPLGKDGRPLNLDFEQGTLQDWTAAGAAFEKQPIRGDTVS